MTDRETEFFETRVRPLLVEHCYACHSQQADVVQGGLLLDSRAGWQAGGDTGAVIQPGRPEKSRLIRAVRYADESLQMPPDGQLPQDAIRDLVTWIEMGAPDPRTNASGSDAKPQAVDYDKARRFWSFRPMTDPSVPRLQDDWVRTPLDAFVLARLRENGLSPAPRADKFTLIRRATFDLLGLPPTPEQIERFVNDDSPEAFARLVDRLLASPHYGERWGRYWLDLARYADTNGADENKAYAHAWRYRDYVIRSFNGDKPYDRFVQEQLAGDLLPIQEGSEQQRRDALTATGFLVLGPKMLAEQDKEKLVIDVVDEQIDVMGRTFLGLSFGCARCHDHKFDPVTQKDYYALAGIFKSTRSMAHLEHVSLWQERKLPSEATEAALAEFEKRYAETIETKQRRIEALESEVQRTEAGQGEDLQKKLDRLRKELEEIETKRPELPHAMAVKEGEPQDVPVHIRGSHLNLAEEPTPRRMPRLFDHCVEQPDIGPKTSGRLQLARWLTDPNHPLTARVMVNRIWQGHFGEGVVRSPSNFGSRGKSPTHPKLLDWLAREFIRRGWSIKSMHRLMMGSSTYQMSTAYHRQAARIDPENRLLWRQNRRRLQAEAVRDALFAVAGTLDRTMGGSLMKTPNNEYAREDPDDALFRSPCRAVYLPVLRSKVYDMFGIFDYSNPSIHLPQRPTTTVAHQALFLLNSPLVYEQARSLAERLLADEAPTDRSRIDDLYLRLFSRPATRADVQRAERFLNRLMGMSDPETTSAERRVKAWTMLCQSLMAVNEFVYLD